MRRAEISTAARPGVFAPPRRWQFVWLFLGLLLALAAPGMGHTDAQQEKRAQELDMTTLPKEVSQALERAARVYEQPLKGARWLEVYKMKGSDHPLYQVKGKNGRGNKIEIEITSAGRIIEVEEHGIPLGEVPTVVLQALKARMPHTEPAQVEAIYQAENARPVCYGFEGTDAAGKAIEVYISADGKTFLN